jgi:hypothetical protein
MLNTQDADTLLSNFPATRLSYEVSIHKNDTQTILPGYKCFILPKGRRCIAWATEWKYNRIFAIIEVDGATSRQDIDRNSANNNNKEEQRPVIRKFYQENGWYPGRVRIFDACFDRTLVYGTVFGGVMFRMNTSTATSTMISQFFSIHNVYWYKGNLIPLPNASAHITLCEELFYQNNIRQVTYTKDNGIIFGLPILCNTDQNVESILQDLPYEVFAIQYRYMTHTRVFQKILHDKLQNAQSTKSSIAAVNGASTTGAATSAIVHAPSAIIRVNNVTPVITTNVGGQYVSIKQPVLQKQLFVQPPDEMLTNIQATFIVRPNIQNDVYELFVMPDHHKQHHLIFHNFALIPTFKTSVLMNRLFRNIIENERLDTMEESEDEVEFENTEPDKYVKLNNEYKMICRFNKRFCKWVPIEITTRGGDIVTDGQVKQHEARYINYRRGK